MNMKNLKGNLMLLLTAFIWGIAFVAQSVGMDYVGPYTFNAARFLLGGIVLIPCIFILNKLNKNEDEEKNDNKKLIIGGIVCGFFLFAASTFQQLGIMYTSVGKAGFITALYIILVPIIGIPLKRKASGIIWISAVIAVIGMYLLCVNEGFSISFGDVLVLICALLFSGHILAVDYFSPYVNGVKLSCIQFFTCGILSGILMFIFEEPTIEGIVGARIPILFSGIMSCGVAYTLQILGQQNTNPFIASLLMSLESVFAVLAGWVLLGQALSVKETIGCILMFTAIIMAQVPAKVKNKER